MTGGIYEEGCNVFVPLVVTKEVRSVTCAVAAAYDANQIN